MLDVIQQYGDAIIGLIGVAVGGIIVSLKEGLARRSERRRDGSYSAIRLISVLEEYAHKCIDVAGDDGHAYGQPAGRTEEGEQYCEAQVTKPDPLVFPDDIAWRSLDETLMHRILALPNKARSTDRYISASGEHAFPPDYTEFFEPRQKGYAQLGLEALDIIERLRAQHRISVRSRTDLSTDWEPNEFLRNRLARLDERDRERAKRLASMESPFPAIAESNDVEATR
ncbi:MAG: hypothetical protein AAF557_15395 [Pseudomonadota bacterium]